MKNFSDLYLALDQTNKTNEKVEAMVKYFQTADAADAAWAIYFLSGRKPRQIIKTAKLREWAAEISDVPDWLFELSYDAVGDLAETIALLLPDTNAEGSNLPLAFWVENRTLPLREMTEDDQREAVVQAWNELDANERFIWNKLVTGSFRVGVSQSLVVRALTQVSGIEKVIIAHRLMGTWSPDADFYLNLLEASAEDADLSRPYPFHLAHQLDFPLEELGEISDWQVEWKWDGIRAQLIRRGGESFLWSRGEDLVSERFPEITEASFSLPDGTVLDGEILPWKDSEVETTNNAKWQIDASAMNDAITLTDENDLTRIHLTTLRRGKAVGKLDFQVEKKLPEQILPDFINGFYQFYAPKQIFVPCDFPQRKSLEEKLTLDFGHRVKIVAQMLEKLPPSVFKAHKLAPHSFKHKSYQTPVEISATVEEIKTLFNLKKIPRRIECFDVAHLGGKEIVAARVVAIDGVLQREDGLVWEFENLSETAALAAAVLERIRLLPSKKDLPDLLMVDGAKPQINAVRKILEEFNLNNLVVIGAVKPLRAHNQISHFLTMKNTRLEFDKRSRAMNFLQTLRDASHNLANETHRRLHSLVQIFKNNDNAPRVQYLLVPTRFAERFGNAEDLSPIRSMTQAGEVILKTKSKPEKI